MKTTGNDQTLIECINLCKTFSTKNGHIKAVDGLNLSIKKGDGSLFNLNKDGSLKDIKLFVSQSDTDMPTIWVDGNKPYKGYGTAAGLEFNGLDLFKSTQQFRQITFGQRPQITEGFIYIRVGVKDSIDIKSLVDSVKESIDEWSK